MAKISVIGIVGKSVFMTLEHFHEKGETVAATSMSAEIGGKGFNQAVAARRMGAEVFFLCAVGDDESGKECSDVAIKNDIAARLKVKKKNATPYAVILTDKNGENRVTVYKSAELTAEDVFTFEEEIKTSDVLLLQQEVPVEVNETAVEIAIKYGVKVILNPAPTRDIPDELLEKVFAVIPNEHERYGINVPKAQNCITTLGKDGCSVNDEYFIEAQKVNVIDTTGAGDTFCGVFAVCIAEGMTIYNAALYATVASGISVTKPRVINSIPDRLTIEREINNE